MPEILDVHDILALEMSHASTLIMNDRQKPQNVQSKLNTQQRCVNFVNHLDRIRVLATLCLVKSKVTATSPGLQWLVKGTDTMLAPGTAPPGAAGDPTTQHRVLRGVLQPGDKPPARALAQITSGKAGYHLGLAMLCQTHWIQRRWPPTGTLPWIWAIPTAHTQIGAGPDTRPNPPPKTAAIPHLRVPCHPQGPQRCGS